MTHEVYSQLQEMFQKKIIQHFCKSVVKFHGLGIEYRRNASLLCRLKGTRWYKNVFLITRKDEPLDKMVFLSRLNL